MIAGTLTPYAGLKKHDLLLYKTNISSALRNADDQVNRAIRDFQVCGCWSMTSSVLLMRGTHQLKGGIVAGIMLENIEKNGMVLCSFLQAA